MPKLSHHQETSIRRTIRDAYAIDPLMDQTKLLDLLEKKFNHRFDHRYIARLKKKVDGEATPRLDRQKIEPRLRQVRETYRIAKENLLRIAYGETDGTRRPPADKDRIGAWRAIAMMEKLQLDAEIDLRIYDQGAPDMLRDADFRARPMPPETLAAISQTFQAWGSQQDLTRKIEMKEIVIHEVKNAAAAPPAAPPDKPKEAAPKIPGGMKQTNAIIRYEPKPDGTVARVAERSIIDPARLIPADPEYKPS